MDEDGFDRFARLIGTDRTRRHLFSVLIAGKLATTLPGRDWFGTMDAEAKKKKKKKKKKAPTVCAKKPVAATCTAGSQCCSGRCEEPDAPCSGDSAVCCNTLGQPCESQCECCKVDQGRFHPACFGAPGKFVCCVETGTIGCAKDADCCNDSPPVVPVVCDAQHKCCLPTGTPCTADVECCTGKVCQGAPKTCS